MDRRFPNWWVILLWIPAVALVLGLAMGCAAPGNRAQPIAPPATSDLVRLVAEELDSDPRFDPFTASESSDARRMAALFRPVVARVDALVCRAATADSIDCTLEVVLQFPAMNGRESRTYWERRLRRDGDRWQLVSGTQF